MYDRMQTMPPIVVLLIGICCMNVNESLGKKGNNNRCSNSDTNRGDAILVLCKMNGSNKLVNGVHKLKEQRRNQQKLEQKRLLIHFLFFTFPSETI